jgi:hypothetical protein
MAIVSSEDRRSERSLAFRFYKPEDREQVVTLFKKQNLNVHLPLPGEDPAAAIGIVAERNGEIKYAFFLRSTYELHLVADPDEENQAYAIRRLGALTEGAAMQAGVELAKLKFAVPTDAIAFVPKEMPDMREYMKTHLGFIDEPDVSYLLTKRLGS